MLRENESALRIVITLNRMDGRSKVDGVHIMLYDDGVFFVLLKFSLFIFSVSSYFEKVVCSGDQSSPAKR